MNYRWYLRVFAWSWAGLLVLLLVGTVIEPRLPPANIPTAQHALLALVLPLFAIQLVCIPPLLARLITAQQEKAGNVNLAQNLNSGARFFVYFLWGVWGLGGLAVGGYFLLSSDLLTSHRSTGTLYLEIGETIDHIRQKSTVPFPKEPPKTGFYVGQDPFDLQLGAGGPLLTGCRYYWVTTKDSGDGARALDANVGISSKKAPKLEIDRSIRELGGKFAQSGWARGRYDYSLSDHPDWHRGSTDWDGYLWSRGNTFVRFMTRRMDDPKPDEAADAGEFIIYAEIDSLEHHRAKDLIFTPPI
jgi:hypothetical protein